MSEWYCPKCDFKNKDTNKTCTSCGAVRSGARNVNSTPSDTWICTKCNHKNSANISSCYSCGKSRYEDVSSPNALAININAKTAVICIAVASALILMFVLKDSISVPQRRDESSIAVESTTAEILSPSTEAKPSKWVEYAADYSNLDVESYDEIESTKDGKYILTVYINQPTHLTKSLAVRAMHNDVEALLKSLQHCNKLDKVTIFVQGKFSDDYGNESVDTAMRVNYSSKTLSKINFSGNSWDSSNIPKTADGYWVHKSLKE